MAVLIALGLVISLAPLVGAQQAQPAQAQEKVEIIEQILVKVNGEILTKTELEDRQVSVLRQLGQVGETEIQQAIAKYTPQILADAIDEMLLVQRGRELGYRLAEDQFKEIVERIKKENRLEDEEQFQAALRQEGMTMADLRRSLERQMLVSRVQQIEVWNRVGISEEEAKEYYEAHREQFTTPASVTLRELLVAVDSDGRTFSVGRDEEAKEKAEAARQAVLAGESFEAVATRVSDAPSRANGGLVGPIRLDELAGPIRELLENLQVGDLTEVFRTQAGYQVLQLESRVDSVVLSYESAREEIAEKVFENKRHAELDRYLDRLRSQAIIEWKNDELKRLFEEYQGQQTAAELGRR
jgi:peptidyl-prolyl cis-trans isomerase SurA